MRDNGGVMAADEADSRVKGDEGTISVKKGTPSRLVWVVYAMCLLFLFPYLRA
jgi:hypothetical protein